MIINILNMIILVAGALVVKLDKENNDIELILIKNKIVLDKAKNILENKKNF